MIARRLAVSTLAAAACLLAVGPGLDVPGITVDEPINVGHGKRLAYVLFHQPLSIADPRTVDALFRTGHEHPPLTRLLIGVAHHAADPQPEIFDRFDVRRGRPASLLALAGIVFLAAWSASGIAGPAAGLFAAALAGTMPRLVGHGRLASPEVISAFFILLAVTVAGRAFKRRPIPGPAAAPGGGAWMSRAAWIAVAGAALGLALLTKLTAVVLLPAVGAAVLRHGGMRRLPALAAWGLAGLAVMIAGWPWLWPVDLAGYPSGLAGTYVRLKEFALVGVNRATVYTWYLGRQYPNAAGGAPWHYAPFHFFATMPTLHAALGPVLLAAAWVATATGRQLGARSDAGSDAGLSATLHAALLWATLALFVSPFVAKYDCERLFVFALPSYAVLSAAAFVRLVRRVGAPAPAAASRPRRRFAAAAGLFGALVVGLGLRAEQRSGRHLLSYFNDVVQMAQQRGLLDLELDYWGEGLDADLLEQVRRLRRPDEDACLFPTLYAGHAAALSRSAATTILPGDAFDPAKGGLIVLFRRPSYINDRLPRTFWKPGVVDAGEVEALAENGLPDEWLTRVVRVRSAH